MTLPKEDVATHPLTLTQELILMLLNEESGYFHQVPGWDLNCAIAGAVLAELSLLDLALTRIRNHCSSWTRQKRATPF